FQGARMIGIAHDVLGAGDVDPLRVRTRRIERDAVGVSQTRGKGLYGVRLVGAWFGADHHDNPVRPAARKEDVAVWSDTNNARAAHLRNERRGRETRHSLERGARGFVDNLREIPPRRRFDRSAQIVDGDLTRDAWRISLPIAIGRFADADVLS